MLRTTTVSTALILMLSLLTMGASATNEEAAQDEVGTNQVPETLRDEVTLTVEQAEDGRLTTGPVSGDIRFAAVAFEPYDGADELRVRSSADGDTWTDWVTTERMDATDGPDTEHPDVDGMSADQATDPVWVDDATLIEVEVLDRDAGPGDLQATLVDTVGLNDQPAEEVVEERVQDADAANAPAVVSRAGWGADESVRTWEPEYAASNSLAIVHHTAGDSTSPPDAIMRGIYHFHAVELGWGDIGYNFVIAPDGTIYEGRYGGIESTVVGGHALNYNTGSFGVSVMGDYTDSHPPQAAYDSIADVIGWKSNIHGMDPEGTVDFNGEILDVVIGHRDVDATICPGLIYDRLDDIRADAAAW